MTGSGRAERCQNILAGVSSLSATEIDELFKILHNTKCEYSHNNNGIFINLRWVDDSVLSKIEQFMAFCNKNRIELEKYEKLRHILTGNFAASVSADEKGQKVNAKDDANAPAGQEEPDVEETHQQTPTIVGGMTTLKFNLLKKKFAKPFNASSRFEQGDLVKETPPALLSV